MMNLRIEATRKDGSIVGLYEDIEKESMYVIDKHTAVEITETKNMVIEALETLYAHDLDSIDYMDEAFEIIFKREIENAIANKYNPLEMHHLYFLNLVRMNRETSNGKPYYKGNQSK